MENKEIIGKLEDTKSGTGGKEKAVEEKLVKFLVFHINEKHYALYADQIREIVMDVPLFFVPFVPPYIRGFINRHGEPYTVFDLHVLFEKEKLDSATYLILNLDDDQMAFLISDVLEIVKIPEKDVHMITAADEQDGFFLGSITSGESETFILNLTNILGRLESDLELS